MRPVTVIYLYEEENKFFGNGPCQLLHAIETTGSLRAASLSMGLSYSKALAIVKRAEDVLGYPLTRRSIGGKGGGGSCLTEEAKTFLNRYEAYREACCEANERIYQEHFSGGLYHYGFGNQSPVRIQQADGRGTGRTSDSENIESDRQ